MTASKTIKYICPYCKQEFEMDIYDSVNVKEDRDLRDRCVSGEIFQHECTNCHKEYLVQNDLLYTDPEHKFVIWVSKEPVKGVDLSSFVKQLDKAGYTLRRCATVKEFVEKIQILEDGVNDIAVELAKYDCFIEFVDNKKGNPADVTSIDYQRTENDVMKIIVKTDDKGMAFLIPVSMLEEELEQNPDLFKVENTSFPLVDGEWMRSLFEKPMGQA